MIWRFGDCELDEQRSELRRDGVAIPVQPKPLALLAYLITHRDRVVPKEELLDRLWGDVVVTEGSLTKAVSIARSAIGDRERETRIRSYARRGYRFVGEVIELATPSDARASGASRVAAAADPFVGRGRVLSTLREAWSDAGAGRGRVVLLSGEAGIGKSRLAEFFSAELRERGAIVMTGRCEESEGQPAFWPFVQVLRAFAAEPSLAPAVASLGASAGELAALVPELVAGRETIAPARGGDGHAASRFLLFDAVSRLLALAGAEAPLAIVLEDLQWATRPSLLLLEHLAPIVREHRLLVLGTVREEPREREHPLVRTLSTLKPLDHVRQVSLEGFSREEVSALLEARLGRAVPARLVSDLFARTEGNPLFLREALRMLADQGQLDHPELVARWRLDRLPQRTRDVVRHRLRTVSDDAVGLLEAAATLGRVFHAPIAARVADAPREDALDWIDEAVRAGIVEPADEGPASFRFAHPLFQEATYEAVAPGRRARLHQRAGETLEALHAGPPESLLSELAHHFHRGLAVGDPAHAKKCALAAAARAERVLAFEQAALHYGQALDAHEQTPGAEAAEHLALLLALGDALRLSGERTRRREVLARALDLARGLGEHRGFGRAAIGFCDMNEWGPRDAAAERVLAEALERVPSDAPALRARLKVRLAYLARLERGEAEPMSRAAIALARAAGDADALQEALYALHLTLAGPDDFEERRALVSEMARLAEGSRLRDLAVIGLLDLAGDHLTEGRLDEARRASAAARTLAGQAAHRSLQWHQRLFDVGIALLEGRYAEAETGIRECLILGTSVEHPYAVPIFISHTFLLLRDLGRVDELARHLPAGGFANGQIRSGIYARALPACVLAESGAMEAARAAFERVVDREGDESVRRIDWLPAMALLAPLCHRLEDGARARRLLEWIEPYTHLHAVMPVAICYEGPIARGAALLASTVGEIDAAERFFEESIERCDAVGARPMAARTRLELGMLLARRGRGRGAREHLARARADADALGMVRLAAAASAGLAAAPAR